jgi:hypothetical protein
MSIIGSEDGDKPDTTVKRSVYYAHCLAIYSTPRLTRKSNV